MWTRIAHKYQVVNQRNHICSLMNDIPKKYLCKPKKNLCKHSDERHHDFWSIIKVIHGNLSG